ncbi:uncharacterized protein LOC144584689 [Pogona vitticeps]
MGGSKSRAVAPQRTCGPEPSSCQAEDRQLQKKKGKKIRRPSWMKNNKPWKRFHVHVKTAGKTGGCENKFLKDLLKHPSSKKVSIKVKDFREDSRPLTLLFCPIASRMGTDIENALEGLSGEEKVFLVVMHLIPKDSSGAFVDTKQQVSHPAVVLTVHTRFTLQDGFYPCEMTAAAVAHVADFIKDLSKRH